MSMYDKNHYNTVISLQLIKINEKKAVHFTKDIQSHRSILVLNGISIQNKYTQFANLKKDKL